MKVKVISRNPDDYIRETKADIFKVPRNYDPKIHPLQAAREYVRALNATKLDRVFAKPFLGNLEGHTDGVSCFNKNPLQCDTIVSGSYDGEVCIWNLGTRTFKHRFAAHEGWVRGLAHSIDGRHIFSVGDDRTIKTWDTQTLEETSKPTNVVLSRSILTGISHHVREPIFATCGETCQLWEENRSIPLQTMTFQVDTLQDVKFSAVDWNLLAACGSDRSIILYDKREGKPIKKVIMTLRSNRLSWNPVQGHIFTVANEDYNCYSFDQRRFKHPIKVHKGHVSAVLDIDWAPSGAEFCTGSYDKTIRIFEKHKSSSREVYHTKRMQHVTTIGWSIDNKFIYSGSDEMNIRLWKAQASEKLGVLRPREKEANIYKEAIKERFAAHPQIKRIARHRHVPKYVYNEAKNLRLAINKLKRKEANRRVNSKPGTVPFVSDLKSKVISEEKPKKKRQ